MSDANPIIRSRALEHFRKTVGMEGSGLSVNVDNRKQTLNVGTRDSFETAMDAVRRLHHRENSPVDEPPPAPSTAESLVDDGNDEMF